MTPPVLDPAALPVPAPVLDTSDLATIAALPLLPDLPREAAARKEHFLDTKNTAWQILQDRSRYRTWVSQATTLAAKGIRPGPSHYSSQDRLYPAWSGGFADAETAQFPDALPSDPIVIFGCALPDAPLAELRDFPPGFDWRALTHQTAGVACRHPQLIGLPLAIRPDRLGDLYRLTSFPDFHGHSCIGIGQLIPSELADYHSLLTALGLSAEHNWSHLQEGLYPLDADCAPVISPTAVPTSDQLWPPPQPDADISDTLAWFASHSNTNWGVYVFGPNCD